MPRKKTVNTPKKVVINPQVPDVPEEQKEPVKNKNPWESYDFGDIMFMGYRVHQYEPLVRWGRYLFKKYQVEIEALNEDEAKKKVFETIIPVSERGGENE